jgi:hypothetical protein
MTSTADKTWLMREQMNLEQNGYTACIEHKKTELKE